MKPKTTFYPLRNFALITSVFLSFSCFSNNIYTSMSDGSWSDTNGTWSKDGGATDCFCSPPSDEIGSTNSKIEINHNIILDITTTLGAGSQLNISSGATLIGVDRKLILSGSANFNGIVQVKSLETKIGSVVTVDQTIFKSQNQVSISGIINVDASILEIINGNIYIEAPSGELYLTSGSKLKTSGNFNNENYTFVCSTCCIESTSGNIQNTSTGTLEGDGALLSVVGNVINDNVVSPNINWCVAGNSFGMNNSENCSLTNSICSISPLSLNSNRLYAFNEKNKKVILTWQNSILENDFTYDIYKSMNGNDWVNISSNNHSTESDKYMFNDINIQKGVFYYKIKFISSGSVYYSNISSVTIKDDRFFNLYPNPAKTNDYITLESEVNTQANLKIYSQMGQLVSSLDLMLKKGRNSINLNGLNPSFYTVIITAENSIYNQQLIISQ